MKLLKFLNTRKNRDVIIVINVVLSIGIALLSVAIDAKYGELAIKSIYILQAICTVNLVSAFILIGVNIWQKSKAKLEKRDKTKGKDK